MLCDLSVLQASIDVSRAEFDQVALADNVTQTM